MEKRQTAGDIVFSAALQTAQDMIDATQASVKDMVTYGQIFKTMASSFESVKNNLKQHISSKKWASKVDKEKMRLRIRQIDCLVKACMAYSRAFEKCTLSIVITTERLEGKEILDDILDSLEIDPDGWED